MLLGDSGTPPSPPSGAGVLADDDRSEEDGEWPFDAQRCPLWDTPIHLNDACPICGGRDWATSAQVAAYLGEHRVACLFCGGEGATESGGPVTWTCHACLGTGRMPDAALADGPPWASVIVDQEFHGADLRGVDLRGVEFADCDFTGANFAGADLAGTTFKECLLEGANPERAAALVGALLRGEGLSVAQRATCAARGAIVDDDGEDDGEDAG